ncbi:hypothetical protein [Simkania negevensis]|nr:hypothetical protein [Simkania negevensis]
MSSIRRCQDGGINHTAHFEQGHFQDSTGASLPKTSSNIEKDKEAERLKQATLIETNHFSFFGSLANRILNLFIYVFWTVPASACSYFTSSNSPAVQLEERPHPLGQEISIASIDRQLSAFEKHKNDLENDSCLRTSRALYQPSDLDQVTTDLSAIAEHYPFARPSLGRRTFKIVRLQLESLPLTASRLTQLRKIISDLFESAVNKMKSSSFFQTGRESSDHLKTIFAKIDQKEIARSCSKCFDALDYFSCISTTMANYELRGITILPSSRSSITAEEIVRSELHELISKAHEILLKALKKEELCINDRGWINREQGIPNFLNWSNQPNPTLEERLTSIVGGLIVLEYFKQHKKLLKNHAQSLKEQQQRKSNARASTISRGVSNITPASRFSEVNESILEAIIQELLHLILASTTTLIRPNPKYLTDQMVSSFISLTHRALDPTQERQFLHIIALTSRSLLQLHITAGNSSLLEMGKDFIKSTLIRCGISTVFGYSARKPSQELQNTLGGLIHTAITNDERHFVSAGLFLITSKINDFLQGKAQEVSAAGYQESAKWVSRVATAFKSDLSVNAALTDTIITRRQALQMQQVESSDAEPEIEEQEFQEECESCPAQESTEHLMDQPKEAPLNFVIEEHHPYNSWLGRPSKEADYVTVTLNGVKSTFPNRKYAEDYVQQMQRQQRLVHQGNNQSYESQQQALYLGKSPSEIPPAQTQQEQSYRVTYDPKTGNIEVYVDSRPTPPFQEKGDKAAKHALRYINDHINGHNKYIRETVAAYTTSLKAELPPHIPPPETPEYIYHVHKAKDSSGSKDTFIAYASPVNGLGPQINLGEFDSRNKANEWTKLIADHMAQAHHLATVIFTAQAAYLEAGGSIEDLPPIPNLVTHEFSLDLSENKVRLYQNGERIFKKPLDDHPRALEDALGKATTTINGINRQNREITNAYIESLKQKSDIPLPLEMVGKSDHEPLQEKLMDINTRNKGSEKEHGFWYHAWRWPFQKADQAAEWLDDHGVVGTISISKTMPLYSQPVSSTTHEENRHRLVLEREELARMEQSKPLQQVDSLPYVASSSNRMTTADPQHVMMHSSPSSHPSSEMIPMAPEEKPKKPGEIPILEKYQDGELAESNIPAWLRSGANPDRIISLDPKEEIKAQHAILAALSTSVARFLGGIVDSIRNWGSVSPNLDTRGKPTFEPTTTEKFEDLAERAVPYDRTQPSFEMLQTVSDIGVDTIGFYMLGGMGTTGGISASRTAGMTNQVITEEFEPLSQRAARSLAEERAFLEEVQQPAYRSGFSSTGQQIKSNRVINVKSDNPNHLVFCENGKTKVISFADLSEAGTLADKGNLSKAGRALQKKTDRLDSVFPKPKGTPEEVSLQGQKVLDEILNHPDKVVIQDTAKKRYGNVFDIKIGDEKGRGVRFKTDGEFVGFLEPKQ